MAFQQWIIEKIRTNWDTSRKKIRKKNYLSSTGVTSGGWSEKVNLHLSNLHLKIFLSSCKGLNWLNQFLSQKRFVSFISTDWSQQNGKGYLNFDSLGFVSIHWQYGNKNEKSFQGGIVYLATERPRPESYRASNFRDEPPLIETSAFGS